MNGPDLKFGIGLPRLGEVVESAREAEARGFDYVSAGEHVFFERPVGNGLVVLAAAAGATTRIRLMSTITLAPLYPAALLAKLVTTLDVVSGGRFDLGVGVGGEYPPEFEACGVAVKERGARTSEALDVLQRLWRDEPVDFEGRYTRLAGVRLLPQPVAGTVPIWVSGRSEAAMRRCARFGTGWLPYMYTPEQLAGSLESIGSMAADAGRPDAVRPGLFVYCMVHEDRDTAIRTAADFLSAAYRQDFSKRVHRYVVAGTAEDCVARIGEYVDAGARTVIFNSAAPADLADASERLLAGSVLPAVRASR